jgi:hypothetical protein
MNLQTGAETLGNGLPMPLPASLTDLETPPQLGQPLSVALVVNNRYVALSSQDAERILVRLQEFANGPLLFARAAQALANGMRNPARIGFLARAVAVQPGEDLVLLDVLAQIEPRNERLARLERILRTAVGLSAQSKAVSAESGSARRSQRA